MSDSDDTVKPVEVKDESEVDVSKMNAKMQKKHKYAARLSQYLDEYTGILVVGIDNVGSNQMQKVRIALRGKAIVLMGKNTLMRLIIRRKAKENPALAGLLPLCRGNMGLIFTNDNLADIRKIVLKNQVPAAAKSGGIAPVDVFVPPGPTGMDPGQTAFFQALGIATKIARGSIEIVDTVHLIQAGDKVTSSAVALLNKLGIRPFSYGIKVNTCYDKGSIFDAKILDLDEAEVLNKFMNAVSKIAAIAMEVGYPHGAAVPFMVRNAFKKVCALALEAGYSFKQLEELKSGASASKAKTETKTEAPKVEEKVEESESSSAGGMGFDMFGGGGGGDDDDEEEEEDEEE